MYVNTPRNGRKLSNNGRIVFADTMDKSEEDYKNNVYERVKQ